MAIARSIAIGLGLTALVTCLAPPGAYADFVDRRIAAAKPDPFFGPDGRPQKLDFDFASLKGWLRDKGGFHIEGYVAHDGFFCSTYEVGMRFGVGDAQCTQVKWVTEIAYMTRKRQCNTATVGHAASDYDPALAKVFHKINCAERVVRCTGQCTTYVAPASPGSGTTPIPQTPLFDQ